jgi:hypothetical protein
VISPGELHANLGTESLWVLLQYNPLLWLAGGGDAVISEPEGRRSAAHYWLVHTRACGIISIFRRTCAVAAISTSPAPRGMETSATIAPSY